MQSSRLLLALAFAPLALAACGGGKTASTSTQTTTTAVIPSTLRIVVNSISLTSVTHDQPPKGASKGDSIDFTDTLLNSGPQFGKGAAAAVGTDKGTMSFTSKSTARLTGTATLPNGTITFRGAVVVNPDGTISVAVVGGTGKYHDVTGLLKVGKGTKKALNTYTLNFPGAAATGPVA
ncbi:MAG TPA: hypothetical protein VG652_07870 [Gaiellaceae bacterium]|nr:hypothetical protein [Gaiellaceae bacterium]